MPEFYTRCGKSSLGNRNSLKKHAARSAKAKGDAYLETCQSYFQSDDLRRWRLQGFSAMTFANPASSAWASQNAGREGILTRHECQQKERLKKKPFTAIQQLLRPIFEMEKPFYASQLFLMYSQGVAYGRRSVLCRHAFYPVPMYPETC